MLGESKGFTNRKPSGLLLRGRSNIQELGKKFLQRTKQTSFKFWVSSLKRCGFITKVFYLLAMTLWASYILNVLFFERGERRGSGERGRRGLRLTRCTTQRVCGKTKWESGLCTQARDLPSLCKAHWDISCLALFLRQGGSRNVLRTWGNQGEVPVSTFLHWPPKAYNLGTIQGLIQAQIRLAVRKT